MEPLAIAGSQSLSILPFLTYPDCQPFSIKNLEIDGQNDKINVFSLISIARIHKISLNQRLGQLKMLEMGQCKTVRLGTTISILSYFSLSRVL